MARETCFVLQWFRAELYQPAESLINLTLSLIQAGGELRTVGKFDHFLEKSTF